MLGKLDHSSINDHNGPTTVRFQHVMHVAPMHPTTCLTGGAAVPGNVLNFCAWLVKFGIGRKHSALTNARHVHSCVVPACVRQPTTTPWVYSSVTFQATVPRFYLRVAWVQDRASWECLHLPRTVNAKLVRKPHRHVRMATSSTRLSSKNLRVP